jgi:hypothetical protein
MPIPELKSASQLRDETDATIAAVPDMDPRDSVEYTFDFNYADVRGKLWAGKFTNRILTISQRRAVKILKAKLGAQVSVAALDVAVWEMNEIISHLAYSLDTKAKGFPEWAKNLDALHDEAVVWALWKEVDGHEARFCRRGTADSASAEPAGDAGGKT